MEMAVVASTGRLVARCTSDISSAAGALRCDEGNRPLGLLLVGKCLSVLLSGVEMRQRKFGKPSFELVEVKSFGADRDLGGEHSIDCRLRAFDRNASSGNDPQVQGVGLGQVRGRPLSIERDERLFHLALLSRCPCDCGRLLLLAKWILQGPFLVILRQLTANVWWLSPSTVAA
jgi:hypothetical protein